jgi:hypothetical protein
MVHRRNASDRHRPRAGRRRRVGPQPFGASSATSSNSLSTKAFNSAGDRPSTPGSRPMLVVVLNGRYASEGVRRE